MRQIRRIVHDLRDPDATTGLVERLRREASLARTGLGFAPSFVVSLDGATVVAGSLDEDRLNGRVGPEPDLRRGRRRARRAGQRGQARPPP